MRTLDDWLAHIQSVHFRSMDLNLDRVRRVHHLLRLATPRAVITVAGTNGKGSCVAMLDSIYRRAGYRVGTYTSPHLVRYNERVRVDGAAVSDAELCAAFERVEAHRGAIPLTYFEFGTLAALEILTGREVEVAVLEVGMGGRLDAVNILDPDVAFVVSIGLDHTQWLGQRRDAIAREKAGIFRYGRPAVCAEADPPMTIAEQANRRKAHLYQLGRDFGALDSGAGWRWWGWQSSADDMSTLNMSTVDNLPRPSIPGNRQLDNAAGVIAVVRNLQPILPVSADHVRAGLAGASVPGRLQVVAGPPEVVLDVAHNADSAACLAAFLSAHPPPGRNLAVVAVLEDKPVEDMAKLLNDAIDAWFVSGLDTGRGMSARQLETRIRALLPHAPVTVFRSVEDSYECARSQATAEDRVIVFGSFYTVGAIMQHLKLPTYPASECRA